MMRYWFRPKRYGYGATPVTWQGWAVTVATLLVVLAVSLLGPMARSLWAVTGILAFDAVAIGALVIVSYRKTDGEWRWRWGG